VNDISGAIKELGGSSETEEELVTIVLTDIDKDISNTEKEIAFVESLDLETDVAEGRVKTLRNELQRYINRKISIETRLKEVVTTTCSICYDTLSNPIYLSCSHIFCGHCIFTWISANARTRNGGGASGGVNCPECRTAIDSTKIIAIVKEKIVNDTIMMILSKEDQLLDIIQRKPDGHFLIFSRMDTSFGRLSRILSTHHISHSEIKGSTNHMMSILDQFKQNNIRVILLNTYHAGCGIDISIATDVIIYHSMNQEKIQAVGRAQRVGRTTPLTIHNLCYPHEMHN
jgi:SNF2 family DNA or RNA helicase